MPVWRPGDWITVTQGPIEKYDGQIEDVNEEQRTVKASISVFGRPVKLDLDYSQIEKI